MSNCEHQRQCSIYHKNNYECGIDPMGCALYPIFKRIREHEDKEAQDLEKKLAEAKRKLFHFHDYTEFPLGKQQTVPVRDDGTAYLG